MACAVLAAVLRAAPLPEGDAGIASKHIGDIGIGNDPHVIFATGFENGLGGLRKRRSGVLILQDSNIACTGNACAQITATRGKDTGGDLVYKWDEDVERCFVRFYCRFHKDTVTPHHFVNMGGNAPRWRSRGAGYRPPGGVDGHWGTTIEPPNLDEPESGWHFYTYWHEMRSWQTPHGASAGRANAFYGNNFRPDDQRPFVGREKWICVEFMVKMNTLGKHDGEQAFWIDGKKVGHWGPGFPVGSWMRETYHTSGYWNKSPKPFEGFDWRTDERLKINYSMLQWYVSDRVNRNGKSDENIVYFDNYVIARRYIGPVAKRPPRAARASGESVWTLIAEKEKARQAVDEPSGEAVRLAKAGDYEAAAAAYGELASKGGKDAQRFFPLARALRRTGELREWIIDGVNAGREVKTYVEAMGTRLRGKVVSANAEGLTVACMGNEVGLRWEEIPPRRLFSLARKFAAGDEQEALLRELRKACGMGVRE